MLWKLANRVGHATGGSRQTGEELRGSHTADRLGRKQAGGRVNVGGSTNYTNSTNKDKLRYSRKRKKKKEYGRGSKRQETK